LDFQYLRLQKLLNSTQFHLLSNFPSGEIHELKEELDSPKEEKKRDALKKVIAAMTVGKDVSMLFAEVVKCMNTQDLELKKLVYLYIMNYAKSQPELAILAVNTFVKVGFYLLVGILFHLQRC
jgi:vesicle coat complex subunit